MLNQPLGSEGGRRGAAGAQVPGPGIASLLNVRMPTAACLESCNAAAYRASDEIVQSWLRFVGDRLAKDSAFPQQLASCHTVNDFSVVYGQFWQQAAMDYTRELAAITDLSWSAVRRFLQAAEEQDTDEAKA